MKNLNQVYTHNIQIIYQVVSDICRICLVYAILKWYIPGIYLMLAFLMVCFWFVPGMYQVYDICRYIFGIYLGYVCHCLEYTRYTALLDLILVFSSNIGIDAASAA